MTRVGEYQTCPVFGKYQACPVCGGSGLLSHPPLIAGDQHTFTDSSCGPWPCKPCGGTGLLIRPVVKEIL